MELLDRLPQDETYPRKLAELQGVLGVTSWQSPLSRKVPQIPVEGPWWWRGEEEASDTFLKEMGVHLD